jgi:Na+-translocating ferredoxin:NAD+ oxidoreductase RnfA subunit
LGPFSFGISFFASNGWLKNSLLWTCHASTAAPMRLKGINITHPSEKIIQFLLFEAMVYQFDETCLNKTCEKLIYKLLTLFLAARGEVTQVQGSELCSHWD